MVRRKDGGSPVALLTIAGFGLRFGLVYNSRLTVGFLEARLASDLPGKPILCARPIIELRDGLPIFLAISDAGMPSSQYPFRVVSSSSDHGCACMFMLHLLSPIGPMVRPDPRSGRRSSCPPRIAESVPPNSGPASATKSLRLSSSTALEVSWMGRKRLG